ncbi:MAG: integrase [Haloechinothrix sp.]
MVTMPQRRREPEKTAESCPTCLAWGVLYGGYCRACYDFRRRHASGRCAVCGGHVPLKNGYCRLCWLQAGVLADDPHVVADTDLAKVTCHQLAFAGMTKMRGPRSGVRQRARLRAQTSAPVTDLVLPAPRPADGGQLQLHLPGPQRAFDWHLHAELTNPVLIRVRRIADHLGQAHGWNPKLVAELDRALVILLSGHAEGEPFRYLQLVDILHRYGVSIDRVAEVLDRADLFVDDRVPAFQHWLDGKLAELAPGIAADVHNWVRTLQHGGPRSLHRKMGTIRRYVRAVHPVLVDWSARYAHLREVTVAAVTTVIAAMQGHRRRQAVTGLRSLMRHCKKTGTIFGNPTSRIRDSSNRDDPVILPLAPNQIDDATQAATTPAARLTLALAAVHAARPDAIRKLRLDDVDLGNRQLTIATVTRPLDELTHQLLLDWLTYRRDRWPNTANPHLIINKQTANTTRPVSDNALTDPFRRRAATLEALRVDRQLDEALTHGPDPLHLAAVFGLDETTAIRYSTAARHLLHTVHHDTSG